MKDHFIKKIKIQGPISISEYMAESIWAPKVGYYDSENSIGKKGDFITGPEISQMFGELIGVFFTECWKINNKPQPIHFIDMGGGNGTMMKDILRTINKIAPVFLKSLHPYFLENSKTLQKRQQQVVPNSNFINDIEKIPPGILFLTANEFFDCFPVHQFVKLNGHWHERLIDLDDNNKMRFIVSKHPSKYENVLPDNYTEGEICELPSSLIQTVNDLAKRINQSGGVLLIIDYAYEDKEPYGTLQAVKNHKHINPLLSPGSCDLSCKVNFKLVSNIAKQAGSNIKGPISQKTFFENLGINIRSKQLIKMNPNKKSEIIDAANRLTSSKGMGNLFKVMTISNKNFKVPEIF